MKHLCIKSPGNRYHYSTRYTATRVQEHMILLHPCRNSNGFRNHIQHARAVNTRRLHPSHKILTRLKKGKKKAMQRKAPYHNPVAPG